MSGVILVEGVSVETEVADTRANYVVHSRGY